MGDTVDIQNLLQAGYFKTARSRSKSPGYDQMRRDEDYHESRYDAEPRYQPRPEPRETRREPRHEPPQEHRRESPPESRYETRREARQEPRQDYQRDPAPEPRHESRRDPPEPRYERRASPSPIRLPPPPAKDRSRSSPAPPPPTVDDEETILAKEHGYSKTVVPEEEPGSRGDMGQSPAIMEVHEFNPERRFVIASDTADSSEETPQPDSKATESAKSSSSREESSSRRRHSPDETPQPTPKATEEVKSSSKREESGSRHRRVPSGQSPPPTGRRRSRQDLPVLDTEFDDRRRTEHHRSRSAVNGPRPDYSTPSRSSRHYGDQLLSPEITKQSSRGREESHYGGDYRERPRERRYSRISPEHSTKRSDTGSESRPPRRTNSTDRGSDRRQREYYLASSREDSRPSYASPRDSAKSSTRVSREHSRSKDEYPKTAQPSSSQKPVVVQEDRELDIRGPESGNIRPDKPPSRTQTVPLPPAPSHSQDRPPVLKPASTINLVKTSENTVQSPLPYPEEDGFDIDPLSVPRKDTSQVRDGPPPTASMPEIPKNGSQSSRYKSEDASTSQSDSPAPEAKEWKPPSFDPEKDGAKPDRPVGTYRRYSENREEQASDRLPNCPRMTPVVGKVDWLTLPRTDFNICPDCYGQVFSNTGYRTHFHPVLRPTIDPISCDFGSSPWYRIAWLLTLKKKDTDLQVFHNIAAISTAARGHRCPGDRKTTRDWYTIKDPYTKRPVPEFTVCYQCAKTVEAVLPSLNGVFVPLESRSSPVRSNCALHFTPDRADFVLYFDSFETTADKAESSKKGPDVGYLAQKLERLSVHNACREDRPISDGYWHFMQFLPEFTVCADCFEDVVQPRLGDENVIARNFYIKPQKMPQATCQLYSPRMRDVFRKACRHNDPKYLAARVRERLAVEASIKNKLAKLDREQRDARTEKQIDDLVEEWKEWE